MVETTVIKIEKVEDGLGGSKSGLEFSSDELGVIMRALKQYHGSHLGCEHQTMNLKLWTLNFRPSHGTSL